LTARHDGANIEQVFHQATLLGCRPPAFDASWSRVQRTHLDDRTWVDHAPEWLEGADAVFDELVESLAWRQRRDVVMYDGLVDEPRLTAWWDDHGGAPEPLAILADIRTALSERYRERFDSIGFNLYRDGDDSVAWHGDRHRHHVTDPIVVIVSVGARRTLRLRPRGGGPSLGWDLGEGDLFVMGGSCQHDWEHGIAKVRRAVGPRLSITYRHGARWRDREVGGRSEGQGVGTAGSTYVP
jgi:alkylated DNA repair dioxygenase AlkB